MIIREEIVIPEDIKYLSDKSKVNPDFKFKLPVNCIFDKGVVGCGGTSVAIESNEPYIICVPFVELIVSKVNQYPNERYDGEVYGFYSEHNLKRDLIDYLSRVKVPKIIVTYNSLDKLCKWINPADYNILIDELHLLFTEYSYRSEAVKDVLNLYSKFKTYRFMTATPLEDDFILDELKDLPIVRSVWKNAKSPTIRSIKVTGKVKTAVVKIINKYLSNELKGNAYLFVNSVGYIKDLIEVCGLTEENTRVIYSKNNNKHKITIKRGSTIDTPKKINLITSTAFEGADIYDEDGVTYIISDSAESQTLIDISTKFQQIAGRIRDSKYSDTIYHIFKQTRYSELTLEEFTKYINKTVEETKRLIIKNNGESYVEEKFTDDFLDSFYVQKIGNELIFDPNKKKIDLYNFKICRSIYSLRINLIKEYEKYNFNVENYDMLVEEIDKLSKDVLSFKDMVLKVKKEMELKDKNMFLLPSGVINEAFAKYPFLERAIEVLGFEGIENSNYNISKIKDKLIRREDIGIEHKIIKMLENKFKPVAGDFYKASEIKDIFSKVYKALGIGTTAKSTDILKYYDVKQVSKRIDGTVYNGYIILGRKIIIK